MMVAAEMVDAEGAGVFLGTSERNVRHLTRTGHLPFVRVGPRLIRYSLADLRDYMDANRVPAKS